MHFKDTLNRVLTIIMRIEKMLCQLANFIRLIGASVDRKTNRLHKLDRIERTTGARQKMN